LIGFRDNFDSFSDACSIFEVENKTVTFDKWLKFNGQSGRKEEIFLSATTGNPSALQEWEDWVKVKCLF